MHWNLAPIVTAVMVAVLCAT